VKKTIKAFLLVLFAFILFPIPSLAQTPTATPSGTAILPEMKAGQDVTINTPVNTDLFAAGRRVTIDTTVNGDVYVAGGQVNIKGTVNQNLVVAGGEVTVSGVVNKNLIIAGGQVIIDKTATISGYILGAGDQLNYSGQSFGPARFAGNNIQINNGSTIGGDLEIYSNSSSIDPGARVVGARRISAPPQSSQPARRPSFANNFSAFTFIFFLAQLLVLFLLLRLVGENIKKFIEPTISSPLSSLGWGLVSLIIIPFVILLLFVTVIGIPLGALTLVFYILGLYFATLVFSIILGYWLYKRHWIANESIYLHAFIGYLILTVISFIPFVGPIVRFLAFLIGLGAIFQWERNLLFKRSQTI
jgi:cytoskeletal protein CcmA (bactofilin family)